MKLYPLGVEILKDLRVFLERNKVHSQVKLRLIQVFWFSFIPQMVADFWPSQHSSSLLFLAMYCLCDLWQTIKHCTLDSSWEKQNSAPCDSSEAQVK